VVVLSAISSMFHLTAPGILHVRNSLSAFLATLGMNHEASITRTWVRWRVSHLGDMREEVNNGPIDAIFHMEESLISFHINILGFHFCTQILPTRVSTSSSFSKIFVSRWHCESLKKKAWRIDNPIQALAFDIWTCGAFTPPPTISTMGRKASFLSVTIQNNLANTIHFSFAHDGTTMRDSVQYMNSLR
jgi:hypothetical protein